MLIPEEKVYKMQHVVVADSLRKGNIGSKMIGFCEAFYRSKNAKTIYCHARASAINFYLKRPKKLKAIVLMRIAFRI